MSAAAVGNAPSAAPVAAPRLAPRPETAAAPTVQSAPVTTGDTATLSVGAERPNPFASFAPSSSEVSVDGWKQGKNDSLEGILRNQGYSLSEIYKRDEDGKTLIDKVASANDLKNPNLIHPGQKLVVPGKENAEALSSQDLKPGEEQTASVSNGEVGIDGTMKKNEDGTSTATVATDNGGASISSSTTVPEKGRADTAISADGDTVKAETVAMNGNGSAVSRVNTEAAPDASKVTIADIDRNPNLGAKTDGETLTVTNPGSNGAGDVTTDVDISERSSDGAVENFGRGVAEFFGFESEKPKEGSADGASSVTVTRDAEGATTVTGRVNGEDQVITQTVGDNDDTWLEQGGELVDRGWNWFTGLFSGGAGSEKSEVTPTAPAANTNGAFVNEDGVLMGP
ncbi:MAG: LysM peptidoglycan-binding domain-containing protein [Vulcanimicrobiota bacterium]